MVVVIRGDFKLKREFQFFFTVMFRDLYFKNISLVPDICYSAFMIQYYCNKALVEYEIIALVLFNKFTSTQGRKIETEFLIFPTAVYASCYNFTFSRHFTRAQIELPFFLSFAKRITFLCFLNSPLQKNDTMQVSLLQKLIKKRANHPW